MDYNDTLEWLKSYRAMHDRLIYLNNRIIGVQSINYESSQGGLKKSINELLEDKKEVIHQMEKIEEAIHSLTGNLYSEVLGYRFLFFYTIKKTADEIDYSISQTNRIQEKAITVLSKLIQDNIE